MAASVDPKVAEMRRLRAERYKQLAPSERPHIRECPVCRKPVHLAKVCPESGQLHDRDQLSIVGGTVVSKDKRTFSGKEIVAAIDAARIKWQPARAQLLRMDSDSAGIFQSFVLQRAWKHMRYGIMYGTVDEAAGAVTVRAVYEPEQIGSETTVDPQPDPREERVDALASYLGLQRVGVVLTHPPRDTDEVILEGKELLLLAREQSRFGDHCVLLAIAPNPQTQDIQAQAWQATQQCVQLYQIGILSQSEEDTRFVSSSQALEVAQEDTDEKGHKKCVIKEPSKAVDARWMTAPVAVEAVTSDLVSNKFVRISRPGEMPPTFANLRRYLDDPKRKTLPLVEQLRDFHVLLFLMENLFDWKCDMPTVCAAVLQKDKTAFAAYETILREHMRAAPAS